MKRITILLITLCASAAYAQSKNLQQFVENWPAGHDTIGMHWIVYDVDSADGKWLDQSSVGSFTNYIPAMNLVMWNANLGNFPGSLWQPGDSIIAFGCWDSAYANDPVAYGNNPNHTGFYWLFSDTLTTEEPQEWQPRDTLRPIPKPIVYLQTNTPDVDTIVIEIPNPPETRRLDQSVYDIMGYELYAAKNIGTPNNLNVHIAYIPCQGGNGDTTAYKEVERNHLCETIYYAYKIVFRPDTSETDSPEPGYTSPYFSMNSDAVNLNWAGTASGYMNTYLSINSDPVSMIYIGIDECTSVNIHNASISLTIQPNPFSELTHISLCIGQSAEGTAQRAELKIYDATGRLIRDFSLPTAYSIVPAVISWDGTDYRGHDVPAGVYFCCFEGSSLVLAKKIVKLK